jgi:hypothetical protein
MALSTVAPPTVRIVSPRAERSIVSRAVNNIESLEGARLALLCNSKPNAQVLLDAVADGLSARISLASVIRESKKIPSSPAPDEVYARIAESADVAIFASADCGSCTSWGIHDTAELEKLGVPALCLVAHPFVPMATAQSIALEFPDLRMVVFEGPIAGASTDAVQAKGRAVVDHVISAFAARA